MIRMKAVVTVLAIVLGGVMCQRRPPNYSLDEMPRTSFSCRDKIVGGYYADPETDCQMFHVCVRVAGLGVQDFRFLCPNDTSFDQENQICDDWYNIDCEASTLYYSDNFDLYRISEGVPEFGPSRATPISLGPSSIAPAAAYTKPRRPHVPVNNAVSEDDDDSYLQKADTGDRRLHKDLLRGSSSGNFYANRNNGKEDPEDDESSDYSKNQFGANTQAKKKSSKVAVRKLLTGKRPVQQNNAQEQNHDVTTTSTSTAAPQTSYNNVGARARYNTVQRNRPTTPAPSAETTVNYYQSTAAPAYNNYNNNNNNYNNQNYNARNNNYNQNTNNNYYQTSSTTAAPVSAVQYNSFRSRGNVNYNSYTTKPETSTNYYNNYQESTTAASTPVAQQNNNNNNYYNNQKNNYNAYNTNQYQQQTSTASPLNNYYQSTNTQQQHSTRVQQTQNYQQPSSTTSNYYQTQQQQQQSTNNYNNNNYQQYNNNNYNAQSSSSASAAAAYQQPTTYRTTNYYQQNYNNNNQQQQSTTVNYDNYYKTSTVAPANYYGSNNEKSTTYNYYTSTTLAPSSAAYQNNNNYYDKTVQAQQTSANVNYQTKNLYNFNVKAAVGGTATGNGNDYDPYSSIYNQGGDKYEEPTLGESLKTAPSSNIRPSDLNSLSYQKAAGFNTTVGVSYNFNNDAAKTSSSKTAYQTPKISSFTVAVPTKPAGGQTVYSTAAPSAIPSTKRGNGYYPAPTAADTQKPRGFSRTEAPAVQPTQPAAVRQAAGKTNAKASPVAPAAAAVPVAAAVPAAAKPAAKDNSYDYAYYDDASPSEYDGFEPVGEEFVRTASRGKRESRK